MVFLVRATKADQLNRVKNRVSILINYNAAVNDPVYRRKW